MLRGVRPMGLWSMSTTLSRNSSPSIRLHLPGRVFMELRGRSGGTIFLDGLEYLLLFNDMNKVLGILEQIDSLLKEAKVEMMVSMDPLIFEQRELETLWDAFPHYSSDELKAKYSGQSSAAVAPVRAMASPPKASLRV